ncbi:MAG: hypothetical protein ACREM2_02025 [Vulcanimicrobiaceae bacterium]
MATLPLNIAMPVVLNGLGAIAGGGVPSSGGSGLLLVLIALASIVIPYFWKSRYAPLAYCLPLLVTLYADLGAYNAFSALKAEVGDLSSGGDAPSVGAVFSLGLGAYATLLIAAYLAWRGYQQYRRTAG